jgi:hypothetical protein
MKHQIGTTESCKGVPSCESKQLPVASWMVVKPDRSRYSSPVPRIKNGGQPVSRPRGMVLLRPARQRISDAAISR